MTTRPAVFLDRDGVLNEAPVVDGRALSPTAAADLQVLPGVPKAVDRLRRAGFALVAVTNQPDIASGRVPADVVDAMHASLVASLRLDAVYLCPHDTAAGCECRKPKAGMLHEAAAAHALDLAGSWMVGDRWVDVAAGRKAGVRTILVERPYSWAPTNSGAPPDGLRPDAIATDLARAVDVILGREKG